MPTTRLKIHEHRTINFFRKKENSAIWFLYSYNKKTTSFEYESAIDCNMLNLRNGANEMLFYPVPLGHFKFFSAILAIIWKTRSDQSRNISLNAVFFL